MAAIHTIFSTIEKTISLRYNPNAYTHKVKYEKYMSTLNGPNNHIMHLRISVSAKLYKLDLRMYNLEKSFAAVMLPKVEVIDLRETIMKYMTFALVGMLLPVVSASEANAFVCGRGGHHGGCISSHGSFGIGRNGVVAVGPHGGVYAYRRGSSCYWYDSQHICR